VRVGILGGTGPLGRGLALRLSASGADVTIGSRDPERAHKLVDEMREKWSGRTLAIVGGSNFEATRGDVVVAATPWEAAVPTVSELSEQLQGKVVVSVGNALVKQGREMLAMFPPRASVAAGIQAALPASLVAGACHHLPARTLEDLDAPLLCDVLVCSDHAGATRATSQMLASVPGLRPLDAGGLASAAAIEAFTAVFVTLNIKYRAHSTLQVVGLEHVTEDVAGS